MPCKPKSKTVHCSICGATFRGFTFEARMQKLRRHRKQKHPKAHRESVKKMLKTKGKLDPLKVRKGLIKKPKVTDYVDIKGEGMTRVLRLAIGKNFPEFALYMKKNKSLIASLSHAGFKEESKGKWVLRTNKFNIFVYI